MAEDAGTDDDDEWRFSIDDVGPDDEDETAGADGDDAYSVRMVGEDDDGPTVGVATSEGDAPEDDGGNVAGTLVPDTSVEPGTPDLEGVVFATAGAILTALVFTSIFVRLDPRTIAGIAGAIVAAAGLLYLAFRRF